MKRKALILGFFSLLIIILIIWFWMINTNVTPPIIGTSTTHATITANFQRKTFYAKGYHWIFYCNGSHILYTNSNDTLNWKAPTVVKEGISSSGISIWYDGKVHYAYAPGAPNNPVQYRCGSILGDKIQWEDERNASLAIEEHEYYNAFITVDSQGYPWVSYLQDDGVYRSAYIVKATSLNGSAWSIPFRISKPTNTTFYRTSIFPLNYGKLYAIYASSTEVKGRLWNGSAWESEETITNTTLQEDYGYSAVSHNNEVHLVLLENLTHNILYFNRTFESGWSERKIVQESQSSTSFPVLTNDEATSNSYCFWIHNNIIYMKKFVDGAWENSPSTPFGKAFDSPMWISSFYEVENGKIGLASLEGHDIPFNVKYRFFQVSL